LTGVVTGFLGNYFINYQNVKLENKKINISKLDKYYMSINSNYFIDGMAYYPL